MMQLLNDHHHHIKLKQQEDKEIFQHLCLDKSYNSEPEEQELIKQGYVLHIPPKRKRAEKEEQDYNTTLSKS